MTIRDKLDASKNGLDALLTYANGVTGASDANIGDAVKTLTDGYGKGGGGSREVFHAAFTPEARLYTAADNAVVGRINDFDKNKIYHYMYRQSEYRTASAAAPLPPYSVVRFDVVATSQMGKFVNNICGFRVSSVTSANGQSASFLTTNIYLNGLLDYITADGDVRFLTFTQAGHDYAALPTQYDIFVFEEE